VFVFLPRWYKQHPSLRSLFVSELPVFFPFIQDHYSSNLITNFARVTNIQHDALSYAFRLIFHGQENIMARTSLRLLLIYLLKRQHTSTQHECHYITPRAPIICATPICRYVFLCSLGIKEKQHPTKPNSHNRHKCCTKSLLLSKLQYKLQLKLSFLSHISITSNI